MVLFSNLACGPFPLKLPCVIAINVPILYVFIHRDLACFRSWLLSGADVCFVIFVAVRSNFSSFKSKKRGCTIWCKMRRGLNRFGQINHFTLCANFQIWLNLFRLLSSPNLTSARLTCAQWTPSIQLSRASCMF